MRTSRGLKKYFDSYQSFNLNCTRLGRSEERSLRSFDNRVVSEYQLIRTRAESLTQSG